MADTLLADITDGAEVDRTLLVRDVERRTKRDGSPFLRLVLSDRSGSVSAVMWDDATARAGEPAHIVGRLAEHPRYGRQLTVAELRAPTGAVDWTVLLDGPERSTEELEHDLDLLMASVNDAHLQGLLRRLLGRETETGRRFRSVPAAKYHHHAYPHGLLDHSVAVAQLVSAAAVTLSGVDRDVAVTGALLHDIGKLDAYEISGGCADLGDAGKLAGEIPLGYYRVRSAIEATPGFPPERALALQHVLLAHHGRLEFGSPVAPCTREATLVHAMDDLGGQMGAYDRLRKETAAGESWSRFDRVLEASAFLG
ncbi:MAG: HDIG domain-containing protein [Actinomycetota bacterium]|nr:HDIG domain-containing protein [Actinomycetota bacterium]